MEKIKLIIWDLDETFWKGTLSEEGIEPIKENIELVKTLTSRGIINSIVSKNDFNQAKQALEELGIWEHFIFPRIEWSPKGLMIKNVIENCQLRDVNVLFLDDNHLNLEEAKFYNPNLNIEFPNFIDEILESPQFEGKKDESHSRLNQYKILEKKNVHKNKFNNNIDFLKSSNIQIEFINDLINQDDRVHELIERTNQLNYTKIRLSKTEVSALLKNEEYESTLIKVKDNFGDYGVVGFYSVEKKTDNLVHFVFSCRILNLGITQYVYAKLGFPSLNIVPEVAETLNNSFPDYITENLFSKNDDIIENVSDTRIFFKGGCDLSQMLYYIPKDKYNIEEETNYVAKNNFTIHQDHSQVLVDSMNLDEKSRKLIEDDKSIPFTDSNYYKTKVFNYDYDCLVYSVLMDYTNEIYECEKLNAKLPYGGYTSVWTKTSDAEKIISTYKTKAPNVVTDEVLSYFRENFSHKGQISPEGFIENLNFIRNKTPSNIPIIFINGAEVNRTNTTEIGDFKRHKLMNEALDKFISISENTHLLDVRNIVNSKEQLMDNIRHYDRVSYQRISFELINVLNKVLGIQIEKKLTFKQKIKLNYPKLAGLLTYLKK